VALRFAYKLTESRKWAQDLMARVDLRLVRFGWDPSEVDLARRLRRLVWSEWTHADSEMETMQKAEEGFVHEMEAAEGVKVVVSGSTEEDDWSAEVAVPSHEHLFTEREAAAESHRKASAHLERLRASFVEAGDEVNLLWLKFALEDVTELQKMAAASGRDVTDFYTAAKRRKRAVQRLLADDQKRSAP
jgi:hypothetical protein